MSHNSRPFPFIWAICLICLRIYLFWTPEGTFKCSWTIFDFSFFLIYLYDSFSHYLHLFMLNYWWGKNGRLVIFQTPIKQLCVNGRVLWFPTFWDIMDMIIRNVSDHLIQVIIGIGLLAPNMLSFSSIVDLYQRFVALKRNSFKLWYR